MEPPIQTEYLRSGGAMILIFIVDGASAVISFCIRRRCPGTWWSHPRARCWRTGPYGIDVALHDRIVGTLVDSGLLHAEEGRLKEGLRAPEPLVPDGDDLAVRELVRLLKRRRRRGGLHLGLEVEGDVRELLLDVTDDLTLGGSGEGVATLGEDLHHVVGEVTAGEVETEDGVRERVTLVDR